MNYFRRPEGSANSAIYDPRDAYLSEVEAVFAAVEHCGPQLLRDPRYCEEVFLDSVLTAFALG